MQSARPLFDPRPGAAYAPPARAVGRVDDIEAIPLVDEPLSDHSMRPLRTPDPLREHLAAGHVGASDLPTEVISDRAEAAVEFRRRLEGSDRVANWKRAPTMSGKGATRVRTFFARMSPESLEFLDQQINEWLEAHPECEVKLVTTTTGEWVKGHEAHLICQIWV